MADYINIKTKKNWEESMEFNVSLRDALQIAFDNNSNPAHGHPLTVQCDDAEANIQWLHENHEWLFNFESGGWNSVYAKTKEEAIEIAVAKYNDGEVKYHSVENGGGRIEPLKVNKTSFRMKL